MEFKGRVEEVIDKSGVSKKSGEAFSAYQILVEEEGIEYPQSGVFDIFGDRITLPNIGEQVTVFFSMKTSRWGGKIFGKNNVWKIESEKLDNTPVGKIIQKQEKPSQPETVQPAEGEEDKDGLPF